MPRMLYIPKLIKELHLNDTFLFFSFSGNSWKLRDYSEGFESVVLHNANSGYSVQEIRDMAIHDMPAIPNHKYTEVTFWEKETKRLNQKHLKHNTKDQKPDHPDGKISDYKSSDIKPGESWVLGYSERGIINSLFYEIQKSIKANQLIGELLSKAIFPYREKMEFDIISSEILLEQSFSDFGDADLVLLLNTGKKKIAIFAEAKVKPAQTTSWTITDEFDKFVKGTKSRLNSSNLFTQLYHKLIMVRTLSEEGVAGLKNGVDFPSCSSKSVRKIGNNPVVLRAVKKVTHHLEDTYFLAIIPDTPSNLEEFFINDLAQSKVANLPEWNFNSLGCLAWSDIMKFCIDHKLESTQRVFKFNEGQIF